MILIKIGEPSKWEYKQRYIYEQHYGKIPKGYMVIFLDGNRSNFNIKNLKAISSRDYNFIRNKGLLSNDANNNDFALNIAKLHYQTQDISHKRGVSNEKKDKKMGKIS